MEIGNGISRLGDMTGFLDGVRKRDNEGVGEAPAQAPQMKEGPKSGFESARRRKRKFVRFYLERVAVTLQAEICKVKGQMFPQINP